MKPLTLTEKKAELEAQLKALEQAERAEREEHDRRKEKAWRELMKTKPFEYQLTPKKDYREFFADDEPVLDALYVARRVRPEVVAEFVTKWGSIPPGWRAAVATNEWEGMTYWRTDENILTHGGGGTYVLNDPKLCSDDEWAQIKAGNIPLKFWR